MLLMFGQTVHDGMLALPGLPLTPASPSFSVRVCEARSGCIASEEARHLPLHTPFSPLLLARDRPRRTLAATLPGASPSAWHSPSAGRRQRRRA